MFQYDESSKTYSVAFTTPEETSSADFQDIVLKSTFKMFKQADFHDEWFCEFPYCDTTFWTGGRHHCRMCGMSICDIHGQQNVNLSTHLLPVVKDVPANITSPVLAFSRGTLPEMLEFKRACLLCCDRAKPSEFIGKGTRSKRQLKHSDIVNVQAELTTTQEMLAQLDQKVAQKEKSKLPSNNTFHWGADDELSNKIKAMKEKKVNKIQREKLQLYMDRQAIIQNIAFEKAEQACRLVEKLAVEAQSTLQTARDAAQECESNTILARKETKIQEEYRSAAVQSLYEVEAAQIKISAHARVAEEKTTAANDAMTQKLALHHEALAGALRESRDVNTALALAEAEWRRDKVSAHFMDSQRASFANDQSVIAAKLSVLHAEHVIHCTSIIADVRTLNEDSQTAVLARTAQQSAAVVIDLEQRPSKIADIVSASTQAAEMTVALHQHIIACLADARQVQAETVLAANECIEVGTEIENLLRTNKKLEAQAPHSPNSSPADARLVLARATAACDQIEALLLLAQEVMQAAKMDTECVNVYCAQAQVTRSEAERLAQEMHESAGKAVADATHTKQIESACRKRARELLNTANTVSENAYDDAASAQSASALAKFAEKTSILDKVRQDAEQAVLSTIGAASVAAESVQTARASSGSVLVAAADAKRQAAILQASLEQVLSPFEDAKRSRDVSVLQASIVEEKCALLIEKIRVADHAAETALEELAVQRRNLETEAAAAEEAWTVNSVDEVFRLSQRAAFAEQRAKFAAQMHDNLAQRASTVSEQLSELRAVSEAESAHTHASQTCVAATRVTEIQLSAPTTLPVREACQRAEVSTQASANALEQAESAVETAKAAHLATKHSLETAIVTIRALDACAAECKRLGCTVPEWDTSVVSVLESLQLRAAAALIATEQSSVQVNDVHHQKTLIVAQETGAATALAVTVHAQIDTSAREAVEARIVAEGLAAKAALVLAESTDAAVQAVERAVLYNTEATEKHKQALIVFAALQSALVSKATEVAEHDVILAEATAAKVEALAVAMEKAALHVADDVDTAREEEKNMAALLTRLDELHYRAHCAHTVAETAVTDAAHNADSTDHAIAVANAGYNASREAHENKLKLVVQHYAVVATLSGEKASAPEKAKLQIRSAHRQLDLLKSLGDVSNQRLFGALRLAESVKAQSKADTVAEQAARAEEDHNQALAALEGQDSRVESVSAAQKRAHRCGKVISLAAIAQNESSQNNESVTLAAAQATSLVELHVRANSLLSWAAEECVKCGFEVPQADVVALEKVLVLKQRGADAAGKLSTSTEKLQLWREQGVAFVTSIKDNCDSALLKASTVDELLVKIRDAASGASDAAVKTKHLEVSTAAAASAVLRSTKIQARRYRDAAVAMEQQLRTAQEYFVTRPSRGSFGTYLATALSADMRIYIPKCSASAPLDADANANVKTIPLTEGHVVVKPVVRFGDALECLVLPDDGTVDLAAKGFERSAKSIERERLAAEALLAKQKAAQIKAEELISAAFAADAVVEQLSANAEQLSLSLVATVQSAEEAAQSAMNSLEAVVSEVLKVDYYRVKTEERSAAAEHSLRSASLEANVSEENFLVSEARITAADEAAIAARGALLARLAALEDTVAEAQAWWERDNVSEVDRATELVAFAEQRAELHAQLVMLSEARLHQAAEHIAIISVHTEVSAAEEHATAVRSTLEAAQRLQADMPSSEAASLAVQASLQAAERVNIAATDTLAIKADVLATVEEVSIAVVAASRAASEARAAVAECYEIGGDCPSFKTASNRKQTNRRARQCADALKLVSEKAEMVLALQLDAQQSAEMAAQKCGQLVASRALCDLAVVSIAETSAEATVEAARAHTAHVSSVAAAEATLLRCEEAARGCVSAHERAMLSVQTARDFLAAAEEAEAARVAAELAEAARLEAETLLVKQQEAQARAEELISAAKAADTTAEELSVSAAQLAVYLSTTVRAAQEAASVVSVSVGALSDGLMVQEQYRIRAEELSLTADNTLLATIVEANVSEEHRKASASRIEAADEAAIVTRSEFEAKLAGLELSVAEAEVLWVTQHTPETVRATERVLFSEENAQLKNQLTDAADIRRVLAAEHVTIVSAHNEAAEANRIAAEGLALLDAVRILQADTTASEAAFTSVKIVVDAVDKVKAAADCAVAAKEELEVVVEAATRAAETASLAAEEARSAVVMCEDLSVECPSGETLNTADNAAVRAARMADSTRLVNEQSEMVFALLVQTERDALSASQTWGQAVASRTIGDLAARNISDAAVDAAAEAARALAAHDAAVLHAQEVLARCEETVHASAESCVAAQLSIQAAKDALLVAEEMEAARVAAELAEAERLAAETLAAKQQAMKVRAEELVSAAVEADTKAEELSVSADQVAVSLEPVMAAAEEAKVTAQASVDVLADALVVFSQLSARVEELGKSANDALQVVVEQATLAESNHSASTVRINSVDEATAESRFGIEESLVAVNAAEAEAEVTWEEEQVSEAGRLAQRVAFAEKRAELRSQLALLAETRFTQAQEHVSVVRAHTTATKAGERAVAVHAAQQAVEDLVATLPSPITTASALEAGKLATSTVNASAEKASTAKAVVRTAVEAATRASVEAAQAASEARFAVADCGEMGLECPSVEKVNAAEDVARRSRLRVEAVKRVNEQAEVVLALHQEVVQCADLASQQHTEVENARILLELAAKHIAEVCVEAGAGADRAEKTLFATVAAAETALARCADETAVTAEAVTVAQQALQVAQIALTTAEEEEIARLAAIAIEAQRLAAEALRAKHQAMLLRTEELVSAAVAADTRSNELAAAANNIALTLMSTVETAEKDAVMVKTAASTAADATLSCEKFLQQAKEFRDTAGNAQLAAASHAVNAEENSVSSDACIQSAEEATIVFRAAIEASLTALTTDAAEAEIKWESEQAPETARCAGRVEFAHQRVDLHSKLALVTESRREQAAQRVSVVKAHTTALEAEKNAAVVRGMFSAAQELQTEVQPVIAQGLVQPQVQDALDGIQRALDTMSAAKEEVRLAVDAATRAAEEAARAVADAQTALSECEEEGLESPLAGTFHNTEDVSRRELQLTEALRVVDEHAGTALALQSEAEKNSQLASQQHVLAVTAHEAGVLALARIAEAAALADSDAARALTAHEAAVATAESALTRCEESTKECAEASAIAISALQAAKDAHAVAEKAEAARKAAERAEAELLAAEALAVQKLAMQMKTEALVAAAIVADEEAERLSAAAEQMALSFAETVRTAEEALQAAKSNVSTVADALGAANQVQEQVEELSASATNARNAAIIACNTSDAQSSESAVHIAKADEATLAICIPLEISVATLEAAMTEAEAMWESEDVPEVERSKLRVTFAQERADVLSQLNAALESRHAQAVEHVASVHAQIEAGEATEKAATAEAALESARSLLTTHSSLDSASLAAEHCQEAAQRAKSAAVRASAAKEEVSVAVKAATCAAIEASKAASDAQAAAAECTEIGAEPSAVDKLNQPDNVARRTKQRADAVKLVNEQVEAVLAIFAETEQIAELAAQQRAEILTVLSDVNQTIDRTAETAVATRAKADSAQSTHAACVAAAEEALARCEQSAAQSAEASDSAQLAVEAAREAQSAAIAAEAAEAAAKADEAARVEAEALLAKQQAVQRRATEMITVAIAANTTARALSVDAEKIAALFTTVQVGEEATAAVKANVSATADVLRTLEAYRTRAEELSLTVNNAVRAVALEAIVAEERKEESSVCIKAADDASAAVRSTIAESLSALAITEAGCEVSWEDNQVPETVRIAQRVAFTEQRAQLLSQLVDVAKSRRAQAVHHVAAVRAHTESAEAIQLAVVAIDSVESAQSLQADCPTVESVSAVVLMSQQAAERARAAADSAIATKDEFRNAVEAATLAAEAASNAAVEAQSALAECEEMGIEGAIDSAFTIESSASLHNVQLLETFKHVDEHVEVVLTLQAEAQQSAAQVSQLRSQAVVARTLGDLAVRSAVEAGAEAEAEVTRAQTAHNAALVAAVEALKLCEEAVVECSDANANSLLALQSFKEALIAAKEAEAALLATKLAEAERLAAEAVVAKQEEIQAKAQALVTVAVAADEEVEKMCANIELLSLSFAETLSVAEEALQSAKAHAVTVVDALSVTNEYCERISELSASVDMAHLAAASAAADSQTMHEASLIRIEAADKDVAATRATTEANLAELDETVAEAEARWETEQVTETVRTAQRVEFAEQRAGFLSQLAELADKRLVHAVEHVTEVQAHSKAAEAHEQASASQGALLIAQNLQADLPAPECTSTALKSCLEAAETVRGAADRAVAVKEEIAAAVKAATRAAIEASKATSDAQAAAAECTEMGVDGPATEGLNRAEDVARRKKQRTDAVKLVNEQVEVVLALALEAQQTAEFVSQHHLEIETARASFNQSLVDVTEKAALTGAEAVRAESAHNSTAAAVEEALARCQAAATQSEEARDSAQLLLQTAREAHDAAVAADAARLTADADEAARLEAEALLVKKQMVQNKAEELVSVAIAASSLSHELFADAEKVGSSLTATVSTAEEANAAAKACIVDMSAALASLETYHACAEELSLTADNAVRAVTLEATVAEENKEDSSVRIKVADEALIVTQSSIEDSLTTLNAAVSAAETAWELGDVAETVRIAQRVIFAEQRAKLLSQLADSIETRRAQAIDHVAVVSARNEAAEAHQHCVEVRQSSEAALVLQAGAPAPELLSTAVSASQKAAENASSAANSANETKEQLRVAVEAATLAAEAASQAAVAAQRAVAECEEMGIDCLFVNALHAADSAAVNVESLVEIVKRVDEQVEVVLTLQTKAQQSATQVAQQRGQAVAARTLGDLAVRSIAESVVEAEAESVRAQAAHDATLVAAEAALACCEEAAAVSREASISAALSVQSLRDAHITAEETEAACAVAKLAEAERLAAETLSTKQQALQAKAQELVSAALVADAESEQLCAGIEILAVSLTASVQAAEEAAATAMESVGVIAEAVLVLDQFRTQIDDMCATAENAARDATVEANVSEENSEAATARIQAADDAAVLARASIEASLAVLEVTIAEAEVRWEAEQATEKMRSAERMRFAEQRADLRNQLEEVAENRRIQALDLMSVVHTYMEGAEAAEKAAAATSAFEFAQSLQVSIPLQEAALLAVQESQRAVQKANDAADHATAVKGEVRAAVEAATRAAVAAARAVSEAKAAVTECEEIGVEAPSVDAISSADDVARRAKQRSEAVKSTNEQVERVLSLQQDSRTNADLAVQQQGRAVASRVLGSLALNSTDEAVIEAVCQAARAQANVDNTSAVVEAALLRCIADADHARICAQEALTDAADCQRKLTELESILARSGFGKFLQQEFGAHESIYLSESPSEESLELLCSSDLLIEVPCTSDIKPEVKVSDARVEVELADSGVHAIEMEIVSPRAEVIKLQKEALEAEAAHLAAVQAEESRLVVERDARRQACKESLSWVKKTPTQRSTAPADLHAEELEASVEAIAVEVEETLFSAEEALRTAEEAQLVVMHELGLMNEFHTTSEEMNANAVEALHSAQAELQRAQQTSADSMQRVQQADDAFDAHRSTLEQSLKALSATVVGMARQWEANSVSEKEKAAQRVQFAHQKAALVASLAVEATTRISLANEHINIVREATHTEESKLLVSSAARLSQNAKEMGAYYATETLDDAYFCVKSAVEKVQRLQNLIVDHVDTAEGSILSIQAMCMISPARMSRGNSFHSTSMQSLTAELDIDGTNDSDAVHQHNSEELSRVLMLVKERIQAASVRAAALLQDSAVAYGQACEAHAKGQSAVSETIGAAASAMSNATESISVQTSTISSVEVALMLIQHTSRDIDALIVKTQNNVRKCETLAEIAAVEETEAQERAQTLSLEQAVQSDSATQSDEFGDANEQSERDSIDLIHEIAQIPIISESPTAKKNKREEQRAPTLELDLSVKCAIDALNTTDTAPLTVSPVDISAVDATPRKRSLFGFSRSFSVFGTSSAANAPKVSKNTAPETPLKRTTSAMMSPL